jgi:hypothetical protein
VSNILTVNLIQKLCITRGVPISTKFDPNLIFMGEHAKSALRKRRSCPTLIGKIGYIDKEVKSRLEFLFNIPQIEPMTQLAIINSKAIDGYNKVIKLFLKRFPYCIEIKLDKIVPKQQIHNIPGRKIALKF